MLAKQLHSRTGKVKTSQILFLLSLTHYGLRVINFYLCKPELILNLHGVKLKQAFKPDNYKYLPYRQMLYDRVILFS